MTSKHAQIEAARSKIQDELKGKPLLRVNCAALKENDYADPDTTHIFFLSAGWYRDEPFHCMDCGKFEIWSAAQQKWWYEVAKGSAFQNATRCRTCRKIHRAKREKHKAKTLTGYTKNRENPCATTGAVTVATQPPLQP